MTLPFLKKTKAGVCLRLHSALYTKNVVDQFKHYYGDGLTLTRRGAYWVLLFEACAPENMLDAMDRLLLLVKDRQK